jgi:erythronate-4-phosphate dehydrogenase
VKIVADDKIPYLRGVLEPYSTVVYKPGMNISNRDLLDADALIVRTRTKCDKALLKGSSVKFIATATIGYDHIDREYCRRHGIYWTNAPGCNAGSVQQYIASVLARLNLIFPTTTRTPTIGIIGVGHVGSKIEKLAKVLDMHVLLNDPPRERQEGGSQWCSFNDIIRKSDIITLHVPLNTEGRDMTYHLIDKNVLNKLKPQTLLINSSRGAVVDNQALKQALARKQIQAAVLDVWENEPDIDRSLHELLYLGTPHIAGYSRDGKANGTAYSVKQLSRFFGLELDQWYPPDIEPPENPDIKIDQNNKSLQQALYEAILNTYDVKKDDRKLREKSRGFEMLRGNYPVRREFNAYEILMKDGFPEKLSNKLHKLGFQCKKHKSSPKL